MSGTPRKRLTPIRPTRSAPWDTITGSRTESCGVFLKDDGNQNRPDTISINLSDGCSLCGNLLGDSIRIY